MFVFLLVGSFLEPTNVKILFGRRKAKSAFQPDRHTRKNFHVIGFNLTC